MRAAIERDARSFIIEKPLPPGLQAQQIKLKKRFAQEAVVVDAATGFIRVAFMNKQPDIDPEMLEIQADILVWFFRDSYPTRVIGIPESGLPLAGLVAKKFPRARFVKSMKDNGRLSPSWPGGEKFSVYSFTQQKYLTIKTEYIEPGERYLVIDDVIAHGNAGDGFIQAIQNREGIVVGLGAGWDKTFQGGLDRIAKQRRVPVASVISVDRILHNNQVALVE